MKDAKKRCECGHEKQAHRLGKCECAFYVIGGKWDCKCEKFKLKTMNKNDI